MSRLIYISALAILLACGLNISAQERAGSDEVLKQLLSAPAPTPRNGETTEKKERPENFFDKDNPPPDDAPLEDLFDYWKGRSEKFYKGGPSNTVKQRLLDAYVDDLEKLVSLLPLFTSSETFVEKIKQAFDKAESESASTHLRGEIKKWLVFNSKYFPGELLSLANKTKDDGPNGYIKNDTALAALAKVHWSTAKPLLESLVNSGQQRTSILAFTLLYRHSVEEKETTAELEFRSQLQSIASNRSVLGRARDEAIKVLSQTDWSGRDEWYLSLFSDESLINVQDGNQLFSPLNRLFERDPDKWIPVMTRLVAGKDPVPRQAAASCLARYAPKSPRRDAILPILPWLTDQKWIPISALDRLGFIHTMGEVDIPESVPSLIWIVEDNNFSGRYAARALARYKDPRAIPALKKALAESEEDDRPLILEGLLGSGGLTETEQVDALEAYAAKMITESGRAEVERDRSRDDDSLPVPVSTGRYLAQLEGPPDTLVRAVLTRAANVGKRNEPLRRSLLQIAHRWQGSQVDIDLIKRIAANTAEANAIITVLNRSANLRESLKSELHSLLAVSGAPQGIGAVLLADSGAARSILTSTDQAAQIALLACARLTQTVLPVNLVGPFLKSKNTLLANAAERYLLAEDSKEARTLLLQHHPNEAFITGWRENIQLMSGSNFDQMGKVEEKLRAELFKPDGPREIISLIRNTDQLSQVLRIYADRAAYTSYDDSTSYREREVSKAELADIKAYVSTNQLDDRGPLIEESCHHFCGALEVLILTKEGGRRTFSHTGMGFFDFMFMTFHIVNDRNKTRTHYNFEKDIKGLETLFADESLEVLDVWQRGEEVRIFVSRAETIEELKADRTNEEDDDNETARLERRQRERVRWRARFSWRSLKNKDVSSVTAAPDGYSTIDVARFPLDEKDEAAYRDDRQAQVLTSDSILIARNFDGLWKQVAGTKAVRISRDEEAYRNPVVTPDGKWLVVSKADSRSSPSYLLRMNLETGQEFRVGLKPSDLLHAVVFVPVHNKIMLRRAKDERASSAVYYLLDPKTGEVQSISGEFAPLHEEGKRFLQPTDKPGEYWAAIPDGNKNQTQVGRYNLKDFSFTPVLTVPKILFASMSMWVDEEQEKLYLVYRGELLRLPLK